MRLGILLVLVTASTVVPATHASAQGPRYDYRLLATVRIGTMQKELDEAAAAGFRFMGFMKGDTLGGGQTVCVLGRAEDASPGRYEYRLLATRKTSTMQKELDEAGAEGYSYRDQTIAGEVVVLLERDRHAPDIRYEYRLLATRRTATMEKELAAAGAAGFEFVGVTVAQTPFGGDEVVIILRKRLETESRGNA